MAHERARRPSKISDEALLAAVPAARNLRQLLRLLGVAAYGGNYEVVRGRLRALGVDEARFYRKRPQVIEPEALAAAVAVADGWTDAARLLGLAVPSGATRVKRLAQIAHLDTSHFLGQGWNRGPGRLGGTPAAPLDAVLVRGRLVSTTNLRLRLLREGVLEPRCACCGLDSWQKQPIPLELDHINGDRTDNRLENLRLLCPNCHAQTATYRGRNIGGPRTVADEMQVTVPTPREAAARRLALVLAGRTP